MYWLNGLVMDVPIVRRKAGFMCTHMHTHIHTHKPFQIIAIFITYNSLANTQFHLSQSCSFLKKNGGKVPEFRDLMDSLELFPFKALERNTKNHSSHLLQTKEAGI